MKKVLSFILMALAVMMVFVSCDDPAHEHSFEVVESGEDLVKKCTICGYISDEEITGTLVSTAEAFKTALNVDNTIYLGDDLTLSETVELTKNLVVDLNGKTIKVSNNSNDAFTLKENDTTSYIVEIRNGKITGNATNNIFTLKTNSGLTLDNVEMDVVCKRGIQIYNFSQKATVNVMGCNLKVYGYYVVATNASVGNGSNGAASQVYSKDNIINITNSNLECTYDNGDCTGLLLNVPSQVTITNSTVKGGRQAAILRGGTYIISGSTFEYETNNQENKDRENGNWADGNAVPNAALVIGNRTESNYEYSTTVAFSGKNTLTVPAGSNQLYVYQNNTSYTVTVIGADSSWSHNDKMHGAIYNGTIIN